MNQLPCAESDSPDGLGFRDEKAGPIAITHLGRVDYHTAWQLQRAAHEALLSGGTSEVIFTAEHAPVITLGRSARPENILVDAEQLTSLGVDRVEIERGGDVTYHGPGQVVAYPILDLTRRRRDVGWYMRCLEQVVIELLDSYRVMGLRVAGKTGVWTAKNKGDINTLPLLDDHNSRAPRGLRKIASIGVRMSRWRTLHGLSINVQDCSSGFALINPCGMANAEVTCLEAECGRAVSCDDIARDIGDRLLRAFAVKAGEAEVVR